MNQFMMSIIGCITLLPIVNEIFAQQKIYEPNLASIRQHQAPEWFKDAKFGMFVDWGVFSVPGWGPKVDEDRAIYPDWYLKKMYEQEDWREYHVKTWGEDFERDDFIPLFQAKKYDPEGLVQIAEDAGMKYVIPFAKHCTGFCLWPSSYTERDAVDMGPKRDLIKPLVQACEKRDLKFGFYYCIEEWEYPMLKDGEVKQVRKWGYGYPPIRMEPYNEEEYEGMLTGKRPVEDYYGDYILPQAKEFIEMYDPDILWLDAEWFTPIEETRMDELVSYYYNQAAGRKEVAANDRLGRSIRHKIGDFFTSEYHSLESAQSKIVHTWEENRGISQSFGYNWQDTEESVITVEEFIHMFIRIVSENGNLLLIVNLDGQGALPEVQERRLSEIGDWLDVNGEAIYGSRPWLVPNEGENIRFTKSKDGKYVYAICKEWPGKELKLQSVYLAGENPEVKMLGTNQQLKYKYEPKKFGSLIVEIPKSLKENKPCEYAWVIKMQLN
jgi:alpha-L-fucosidase